MTATTAPIDPAATASLPKVPVTIVTGFLGAGKTTLIRHVLERVEGRRLALIVNEFGDVGVDGDILKSCGIESCPEENIVELANGCICCTVADDFVPTIEALLSRDKRPDHILIETSGLALPKPLLKAFDWPAVRGRVTVDGVIVVVDGAAVAEGRFADDLDAIAAERAADPSIEHDNPLEEVYEDQLLSADLVIVNKTDLIDAPALERVLAEIAAMLPRAVKAVAVEGGRIDPAVMIGLGAAAESDLAARPSHHDGEAEHDHEDFDSVVVDIAPVSDPEALAAQIAAVAAAHDILRVKGFVEVVGKPRRLLVQAVGRRVRTSYDRAFAAGETRQGRLVVIGQTGLDKAAIAAAFARDPALA